jgi:hypothetical protein
MSISVFCLRCANVFKVNEDKAGQVVPCPKCGNMSKAPARPPVAAVPGPSLVYRAFQWLLNVAFVALLAYLYYGLGFVDTFHSWFQNIRHFLFR